MLATPMNHGLVSGTDAIDGTAMTSEASARRMSQFSPAQERPSRDDSTCAAVLLARRVASSCWNTRKSSLAARDMTSSRSALRECRDLGEELVAIDGLHHVIPRALAHAPDLVGLLAFRRAHDDRDLAGIGIAANRARGLE